MTEHTFADWIAREQASILVYKALDIIRIQIKINNNTKIQIYNVPAVLIEESNLKYPALLSLPAMYCAIPSTAGMSVSVWPIPDRDYKIIGLIKALPY